MEWKIRVEDDFGVSVTPGVTSIFAQFSSFYAVLLRNCGARRALVACSNEYASLIKVGSLQARPKNEIPTGSPDKNPTVTLMLGYPATAAAFELPPATWSPLIKSVNHAGPPVGATRASR